MKRLQRQRPVELEAIVANGLLVTGMMQDAFGYAGKGSRPMPKWTFSDVRERMQSLTRKMGNVLTFAFLNERFAAESPVEIPASAETMWWTIRPGDNVLLSDRETHHYTTAGSIDYTAAEIAFIRRSIVIMATLQTLLPTARNALGCNSK